MTRRHRLLDRLWSGLSHRWVRRLVVVFGLVCAFVITTDAVAFAAGWPTPPNSSAGTGTSGPGLLAPFDVTSSEGVPLDRYQLLTDPGGVTDLTQGWQSNAMGGMFAAVRIVIGIACWLVNWAYSFPVVHALAAKSQALSDAYRTEVVDRLGLPGMLLAWAVVVCGVMLLRGRPGRALSEMALSFLLLGAASAGLLRPDVLLGSGGLLDQARQASLEVAAITTDQGAAPASGTVSGTVDPASISGPLQQTLTQTFVVEPYQLLQFGRLIPKGDKAYNTYESVITNPGGGPSGGDPCAGLSGTALVWCQESPGTSSKANPCAGLHGLALQFCQQGQPAISGDTAQNLSDQFKKVDPAIAAYIPQPTWDRLFGCLLLLLAAAVVLVMVVAMVIALIAAQGADALLASCDYAALIWAILPGPNRGVLWRWVGAFTTSLLVLFAAALFLPLFGLTCSALLASSGNQMITRLFLVDLVAILALGFHRRIMAGAGTAGSRLANRMRWARIGGSGSGDDATRTGQVIAGALSAGGGFSSPYTAGGFGAAFAAGNPAHAHLVRRARLISSAQALADIPGTTSGPGRMLGDIQRTAATGLAPLTLTTRAAAHAWKGRALTPEEYENRAIKPGLGGKLPITSALHNRLIQTRGGRAVLGASKIGWGATFRLPTTLRHTSARVSAFDREFTGQYHYYKQEAANLWASDWQPVTRRVVIAGEAAGQGTMTAARATGHATRATAKAARHQAANAATAARRQAANAATAAVIRQDPTPNTGPVGPTRAPYTHTRTASAKDQARAQILDALMRAQREARGDAGSGS